MPELVTCAGCAFFRRDTVGFGQGIGICLELERYKALISGKPEDVKKRLLEKASQATGCHKTLRWPGAERKCEKYKKLDD